MDYSFDLGKHSRKITTASPDARRWFNLGLNWCICFNHEEGVACFRRALEHDPGCAMAHWGIAWGSGPFYNMSWRDFTLAEAESCTKICFESVQRAAACAKSGAHPVEIALIEALAWRYQADHPVTHRKYDQWDEDYANAMRDVYERWPEDADVAALFAEALMQRTPWRLWNVRTDEPAEGASTLEALAVLEKAIAQADAQGRPQHPAILHLHIHVLEMGPHPERGKRSAEILPTLCPDGGHMHHMPAHIHVICGDYARCKAVSARAIEADRKYLDYAGPYNFYTTARCHDLHMMIYGCMLLGQFGSAWEAALEMQANLTPDVLNVSGKPYLAMTMEGYHSTAMHVLVRFGKWQQIIDTPLPDNPALYCVSTAMHHYARAIAHATLGQIPLAEKEWVLFCEAVDRIARGRRFFNNSAFDVLGVGEKMLEGEVSYHMGRYDEAFAALREAVRRDDNLIYNEPWAWMHPPRHALGALLLEQGRAKEAEPVYRADLGLSRDIPRCVQHPDNVWSLHGLAECLRRRGANEELAVIAPKLRTAMAQTDMAITSSCCCRKNTFDPECCA